MIKKIFKVILIIIIILVTQFFLYKKINIKNNNISDNMIVGYNSELQYFDENEYLSNLNYNIEPHIDEHTGKKYVTYEDFKIDGEKDDYYAILAAHSYANKNKYEVKATQAEYNIYKNFDSPPVDIKTNTDWNNATFYIHDENLEENTSKQSLFRISGYNKSKIIEDQEELNKIQIKKDTTNIPQLKDNGNCICIIFNENKKQFKRSGTNYIGDPQTDVIEVNNNGDVMNDILWDFAEISRIILIQKPQEELCIKNAKFITILNGKESKDYYFNRNILCERSNTKIVNIDHETNEKQKIGGPYYGFIRIRYSSNVTLERCNLQAHTYKETSNYDLAMEYSININLNEVNCNNIEDKKRWGMVVSGYTKDVSYKNCKLNRIDAHTGIHNLTIDSCEIGYAGINVVGSGELNIINTTNLDNRAFVILRSDYGSTWDGKINIENCTYYSDNTIKLVYAKVNYDDKERLHDYGYELYLPDINIKNFNVIGNYNKNGYIFFNDDEMCKDYDLSASHKLMDEIIIDGKNNINFIPFYKYCDTYKKIKFYNINVQNAINNIIERSNFIYNNLSIYKNNNINDWYNKTLEEYKQFKKNLEDIQSQMSITKDTINSIYNQQYELINTIVEEFNNKKINISESEYQTLVTELLNISEQYKELFNAYITEDDIQNSTIENNINNVIDRYNENKDIDMTMCAELINNIKEIYNDKIQTEETSYNYLNKRRIQNTCTIISKMLENKIKETAQQEAQKIGIAYNIDPSTLTNKDVIAQIKLPNSKSSIEINPNNEKYTFTENGTKNITINIRGYKYNYNIKVTNIDKTPPQITGIEQGGKYKESITPQITDENLSEVKLIKDGQEVENYKQNTAITQEGIYQLKATDKAGNETSINFVIAYPEDEKYKIENNTIKNIKGETSVETLKGKLQVDEKYTIKRKDTEIQNSENIATGDILETESGNKYTLIVRGDLNKDGKVDIKDLVKMRKFLLLGNNLDESEEMAADTNIDGKEISIKDLVKMRIILLTQ